MSRPGHSDIPNSMLGHQLETALDDGLATELAYVEGRLEDLTTGQLRELLGLVKIQYTDNNLVDRDECLRVMGEARWGDLIAGYQAVAGVHLWSR